jgi:hypothetical protein
MLKTEDGREIIQVWQFAKGDQGAVSPTGELLLVSPDELHLVEIPVKAGCSTLFKSYTATVVRHNHAWYQVHPVNEHKPDGMRTITKVGPVNRVTPGGQLWSGPSVAS